MIQSTSTTLKIRWDPSDYNGGSLITSYKVYYDIGQTGTFASQSITTLA
jgi:hypothetical protein